MLVLLGALSLSLSFFFRMMQSRFFFFFGKVITHLCANVSAYIHIDAFIHAGI